MRQRAALPQYVRRADRRGLQAQVSDLLPRAGHVTVLEGTLSAGFEYPDLGLVVITEGQVLARRKKAAPKKSNRDRVKSFTDLTPGDLVVHEHHGIGRFVGMERMTVDGAERDFIKIAFAGTDFLYVPATSLDLISKYIGGGEPERVRLNKLGGADWSRSKARAKAAAKELAEGLIKLYAERAKIKGYAFPPDDAWQREFEDAFPYEETEDQLRCIAEIKSGHGVRPADGPPAVRRRGLRQDRGRAARGDEVRARGQAGGHPRADHRARAPALPDRSAALSGPSGDHRAAHALQDRLGADQAAAKARGRLGGHRDRHAQAV